MKKSFCILIILTLFFNLCSCSSSDDSANKIQELNTKVSQLEYKASIYDTLSSRISKLETKVSDLESTIKIIDDQRVSKAMPEVYILLSDKGYGVIENKDGYFFIILDNVTNYENGYKIQLSIGNPSNVLFQGFKVAVTYEDNMMGTALGNNTLNFNNNLYPGKWNKIQLTIPNKKTKCLKLSLECVNASFNN